MDKKNEEIVAIEEKDVCGFCGSTETKIEYWHGQDSCCGISVRICHQCKRIEVLQ